MSNPKLAILGLGSQTTLHYISELNKLYNEKFGGYSTCPFVLWNTNFDAINSLLPSISPTLNELTQTCIDKLENLDTEYLLIPNITLHASIDQLSVKKKILHPIHLTVEKIKEANIKKVILFGSKYTMNSSYIPSIFNTNDITIELPEAEDQLKIDAFRLLVYEEKETKEQIESFHKLIEKYTLSTTVVLACTELSIHKPIEKKNIFDMVHIQISEAINNI